MYQIFMQLSDAVSKTGIKTYEDAVSLFGEAGTANLIVAVININALNLLAVSLTMHP